MGFLELFSVASFPVIKILLVTAVGLFLALDNINLLGKDARIQTNHVSVTPSMLIRKVFFSFLSVSSYFYLYTDNSN